MCGITGWVNWQQNLMSQEKTMVKMTRTLVNRGPDAEGYWLSEHVALGHRRLVVVDPERGCQPMQKERGTYTYVLVYNGELYNTQELRSELATRGYQFDGHSDTEVLLLSYMEWGPSCVERFNGIFAFAVWDEANQHLFLARDRLGVKPLFYSSAHGSLVFGSELKALLAHPDIHAEVSSEGLSEVLFLGPARSPGAGIYQGVHELKPGHLLIYSRNGIKDETYWRLPNHQHTDDFKKTTLKVRELFLDTVKRQLVSDVPLGTLLSGGLDSSAITAIAAQEYAATGKGALKTFSVDYLDNDKYFQPNDFQPNSDAPWIKKVSEHFATQHHIYTFDTPELAAALKDAVMARDLPGMADVDSSLLLFSRKIKTEVTVGLSGECADEVFGGYPWFHRQEALEAKTFPWALRAENRLQVFSPDLLKHLRPNEYIASRYSEAINEVPQMENLHPDISSEEFSREKRIREITYLTLTRFMPTLLDRKDRMTMATGLEVRVPFCDHRLVEYVWNIPWHFKAYEGREKGLLRHALEGVLPEDVLWRKKSPYPKTHNPHYLRAVRHWLTEILADTNSPLIPLVNIPVLQDLIKISDTLPAGRPWFGQLMDTAQLFAFLIQVDIWLRENHVYLA